MERDRERKRERGGEREKNKERVKEGGSKGERERERERNGEKERGIVPHPFIFFGPFWQKFFFGLVTEVNLTRLRPRHDTLDSYKASRKWTKRYVRVRVWTCVLERVREVDRDI